MNESVRLDKRVAAQVAEEFGLKPSEVSRIYSNFWKQVKEHFQKCDVFNYKQVKYTDIIIPHFGTIVLRPKLVDKINKSQKPIKNHNNGKTCNRTN